VLLLFVMLYYYNIVSGSESVSESVFFFGFGSGSGRNFLLLLKIFIKVFLYTIHLPYNTLCARILSYSIGFEFGFRFGSAKLQPKTLAMLSSTYFSTIHFYYYISLKIADGCVGPYEIALMFLNLSDQIFYRYLTQMSC
jgi:hypothetical protein